MMRSTRSFARAVLGCLRKALSTAAVRAPAPRTLTPQTVAPRIVTPQTATSRIAALRAVTTLTGTVLTSVALLTAAPAAATSPPGAGATAPTGIGSEGDDLRGVMRLLAQRKHGEVSFVEQHFLALLKRPTESLGELIYDAPDQLEKRTLEPRAESLKLVGNTLTLQRGAKTRVLDLNAYPDIRPFVESIRATLAGDQAALERMFRLEFVGSATRWNLTLFPLDAHLAKSVARIQIDGMQDTLIKIEIRQTDGDRSLMTLRAHAAK